MKREDINISATGSKDVNYAKSIVKEIMSPDSKRKNSSSIREFNKTIAFMENNELIELSSYLTKLIESDDKNNSFLETLLDNILEHITGSH